MHNRRFLLIASLIVATAITSMVSDSIGDEDHWEPVRVLEGSWEGEGEGFGQVSKLTHTWEFVLDGQFLRLKTQSVTQTESGEAEVHEDAGFVSWSQSERLLRFRQFLSEGFVNTFKVEEVISPQPGLNFEPEGTEGMENFSARMTLRFSDQDTYDMILELGNKGGELKPCQKMRLHRTK